MRQAPLHHPVGANSFAKLFAVETAPTLTHPPAWL